MCGFAGFIDFEKKLDEPERLLSDMADTLIHRGPDDQGVWCDRGSGIGFAHRRLSIVDLSPKGHQPMTSHCGRYVIAYNGEIYNFKDIRRELDRAQGKPDWRGTSDTEVALEGDSDSSAFAVKNNSGQTIMRARGDGNVGIGTTSPKSKLEVNGDIQIGDELAICDASKEGSLRYNSTSKKMEFCNGTVWAEIGGSALQVKVGFFTRDTSLASGTQAITGVGFQPKGAMFFMNETGPFGESEASWGFDDGTTRKSISDRHKNTPDTYIVNASFSIFSDEGGNVEYQGIVDSFDSDGFTIRWMRLADSNGDNPTGIIVVQYLVFG